MITKFLHKIRKVLQAGLAQKTDLEVLYKRFESLLTIHSALNGNTYFQSLSGWVLYADAMATILQTLEGHKNPVIVEFGSGQSTIILAAYIKRNGGTLISIDHEKEYLKKTSAQLKAKRLSQRVKLVHAPLIHSTNKRGDKSYNLKKIFNGKIDVALVDGPPSSDNSFARLAPVIWCVQRLRKNGSIFLDDSLRKNEEEVLKEIKNRYNKIKIKMHKTEKGLAEIAW